MDKTRETERLATWLSDRSEPRFDIRVNGETVDHVVRGDDGKAVIALAEDLIDAIDDDFADEQRRRRYEIVAIDEDESQYPCPMRISRRPASQSNEKVISHLVEQNKSLHHTLMKRDDSVFTWMSGTIKLLADTNAEILAEQRKMREQHEEVFIRLETLRSKQLDREMAKEMHDKKVETLERGVDMVLPLGMAMARRLLPAAGDALDVPSLVTLAQSMTEEQLDRINTLLGEPLGPELDKFIATTAFEKQADPNAFVALVKQVPGEKLMHIFGNICTPSQQTLLREMKVV